MTFSQKKISVLGQRKSLALSTFLMALAMAALLFVPYMIKDSGYFLFYGDFNVQQIPFYQHCHELIRSGKLGWDFGTDLGVNFIGSYTFYLLGSPFFLITLLFPNSVVPYLIGPLLILKFALAALAAYMYLDRFLSNRNNARLGAILYAFSGFSVYNIFFNHFHEAIIAFPLLLLAIELRITENRRGVVALAVFAAAVSNYFFFFGMVVFAVIYWIVRVCSGAIKTSVGNFLWLLGEAALGVLMSLAWLLPTVMALMNNSRLTELQIGWGSLMYGKEQIYANVLQCFFFPPDLPARPVFFPEADVKWSSLGGWLPVISMVGVFAFMQQKKYHWLRRVIGIMIFMSMVPLLNSAFYMFNSAYYARWFYMPVLMMCLASCMAIEDRKIDWDSPYKWVMGITLAVSLVIGFMPRGFDEEGKIEGFGIYVQDSDNVFATRFWIYVIITLIGLLLFRISLYYKDNSNKRFLKYLTVSVCVISVVYSSMFVGFGKTHSFDEKTVLIDRLLRAELTLPGEKGDYRIDCFECVDNTGMYLGYNTINAFHSIVPVSVTEFYEFIGEERGVASRPTTDSYAARSLLSVKYLVDMVDEDDFDTDTGHRMPGYEYIKTDYGYDVYENINYIPYGFTYDYYITREEALMLGTENASAMMLKAMVLELDQIEKYSSVLRPLTSDYSFDEESNKPLVEITDETYDADCDARAQTSADEFTEGKNSFRAKITLPRKNLVFFSIPYDEGWTAYVNGKKAEIEKVNVGFMAVLAPEGENEIEFVYETPGLKMGIAITVLSVAVLILYLFLGRIYDKRLCKKLGYPEGDELLERWQEYKIADSVSDACEQQKNVDNGQKKV